MRRGDIVHIQNSFWSCISIKCSVKYGKPLMSYFYPFIIYEFSQTLTCIHSTREICCFFLEFLRPALWMPMEKALLTPLCRMNFPILIIWESPFPNLGFLNGTFHFY